MTFPFGNYTKTTQLKRRKPIFKYPKKLLLISFYLVCIWWGNQAEIKTKVLYSSILNLRSNNNLGDGEREGMNEWVNEWEGED